MDQVLRTGPITRRNMTELNKHAFNYCGHFQTRVSRVVYTFRGCAFELRVYFRIIDYLRYIDRLVEFFRRVKVTISQLIHKKKSAWLNKLPQRRSGSFISKLLDNESSILHHFEEL